jgi:hypothetical protein
MSLFDMVKGKAAELLTGAATGAVTDAIDPRARG